jgi:hypothetical protein
LQRRPVPTLPIIICFVKKIIKYFCKIADSNTGHAGYAGS